MKKSSLTGFKAPLGFGLIWLALCPLSAIAADLATETAAAIRKEATLPNAGPQGRPLPLVGSWNSGTLPNGYSPDYQIGLIESGHHLLPWFALVGPGGKPIQNNIAYYRSALLRCAELDLPISFLSSQWESLLSEPPYFNLPAAQNPNVVKPDGRIEKKVSPFGPVAPWRELGLDWTQTESLKQIQAWYPTPPKVLFISNNEHTKLAWKQAADDKRFAHLGIQGDEATRKAFAEGWAERYRALQAGMRTGLKNPQWRENARFIGYSAFGPSHFGRWPGWLEYSLAVTGRIDPAPITWDGGSPPYYTNDWTASTDSIVWSPQIEAMNWIFMQEEAHQLNPQFWFELSVWDGYQPNLPSDKRAFYAKQGQSYTPERYAGMIKFGLWLTRPRLVREYRNYNQTRSDTEAYFLAIVDAVDEIHARPELVKFWRKGKLVANPKQAHPYQTTIPPEYRDKDRWFLLDTNLTPARPWELTTEIPVFALALALQDKGKESWLIYLHAPRRELAQVQIEIPDYGKVTVSTSPQGNYYLLNRTGQIKPLTD